jgi:hypothetical protein
MVEAVFKEVFLCEPQPRPQNIEVEEKYGAARRRQMKAVAKSLFPYYFEYQI